VILVSRRAARGGPAGDSALAGIGFAFIAALGFGGFYIFLGLSSGVDPVWSIVIVRAASGFTAFGLVPFVPLTLALPARTLGSIVVVGLLATAATLCIAVATTIGQLSTTSVLASLSTLVPIVLSRVFLGERLARSQQLGVVFALAGVALIASKL
jgi:drug/metabolite transporter (DMT)-like permease